MSLEFNFIHTSISMKVADKLLDDFPGNGFNFHFFDDKATMAHLMHKIGQFESVNLARKNGWNKPIPLGFTMMIVGKRKINLTIINVHPDDITS